MLAIKLDPRTEARLESIAQQAGQTPLSCALEAIESYIQDVEDFYVAKDRLASFRESDAIPLDEVEAKIGLAG